FCTLRLVWGVGSSGGVQTNLRVIIIRKPADGWDGSDHQVRAGVGIPLLGTSVIKVSDSLEQLIHNHLLTLLPDRNSTVGSESVQPRRQFICLLLSGWVVGGIAHQDIFLEFRG